MNRSTIRQNPKDVVRAFRRNGCHLSSISKWKVTDSGSGDHYGFSMQMVNVTGVSLIGDVSINDDDTLDHFFVREVKVGSSMIIVKEPQILILLNTRNEKKSWHSSSRKLDFGYHQDHRCIS
jgi:hypothetical protein